MLNRLRKTSNKIYRNPYIACVLILNYEYDYMLKGSGSFDQSVSLERQKVEIKSPS